MSAIIAFRSTLAASTVSALDVADETVPGAVTYEPINLPDFHAYIDDIVLSVKREIRAENIKVGVSIRGKGTWLDQAGRR